MTAADLDAFLLSPTGRAALTAFHIVAIVSVTTLAHMVLGRTLKRIERSVAEATSSRATTLGRVLRYVVSVILWLGASTMVLHELGIPVGHLVATAGVAGIAVGFGAQSLVRDYFAGVFLLVEDTLRIGDVVRIADRSGKVEAVTLRYVRLRTQEGHVLFVPNGEIKVVENHTRDFAYAVIEAPLPHDRDVEDALTRVAAALAGLREDTHLADVLPEAAEPVAIDKLTESAVILRARIRVLPASEAGRVRRAGLHAVKRALDGVRSARGPGGASESSGA